MIMLALPPSASTASITSRAQLLARPVSIVKRRESRMNSSNVGLLNRSFRAARPASFMDDMMLWSESTSRVEIGPRTMQ